MPKVSSGKLTPGRLYGIGGMVFTIGNWYDPAGPDDIYVIIDAYLDFIMHGLLAR